MNVDLPSQGTSPTRILTVLSCAFLLMLLGKSNYTNASTDRSKFTLKCVVRRDTDMINPEDVGKSSTYLFTFDLTSSPGRYYDFDLREWEKISGITETLLDLSEVEMPAALRTKTISRSTGIFQDWMVSKKDGKTYVSISGTCEKIQYKSPPTDVNKF
jgi:hypothetical protein